MINRLMIFVLGTLVLSATSFLAWNGFDKGDVARAQKLIGLSFTEGKIDTMYENLMDNKAAFDTLRSYELDYTTTPALFFDPRPVWMELPKGQQPVYWDFPEGVRLPDNREELAFYSVAELSWLIRHGKVSSTELTRLFLDRIRRYDGQLQAVITLTEDLALEQAARADRELASGRYRGPLHGIPYGAKDIIAVEGYKTTWGSEPYKDQMLEGTATVIEKLEAAGAVLVAKLTSGALARGDVWFGGQTKNPWDLSQGASGSSAGSASATAAGLVAFAIGTETLGSIISPASRCGVTGLRPTYGRVSRAGVMSLSWTFDKVGPICRDAFDCALVLDVIRGSDPLDRTAVDAPFNYRAIRTGANLRVGVLAAEFDRDTTAAGTNGRAALEQLAALGVQLQAETIPTDFPYAAFDLIIRAEGGAFFDELVLSGEVDQMVQQGSNSRANSLRQSRFIPAVEYLQANRHRSLVIEWFNRLMQNYDVLIAPRNARYESLITNMTGHPSLSIPTGLDAKGRPTSIVLIGNLYDEARILELGRLFQEHTDFDDQQPPLFR
ncbi:MAG: amidase [Saprospiraceae bacterium]|nr:amidase [Saprospiraceae bacterium]MDP4997673.1 amidase [Saprospiraceae bacterium]